MLTQLVSEAAVVDMVMRISRRADRRQRRICVYMARSCAITQFADGVIDAWRIDLGMFTRIETICMTSRAIRLIRRLTPDVGFCIADVAVITGQRRAMTIRKCRRLVAVGRHRPVRNTVTLGAIAIGNEMTGSLASR